MPKGVILTHGNLIADCAGVTLSGNVIVTDKDVHLSYLPLAHMFERLVILAMINGGAAIGFFRGVSNSKYTNMYNIMHKHKVETDPIFFLFFVFFRTFKSTCSRIFRH
jgi:long-subunit acyl-CoA synthetase (AMP-forming)